jgi:uncharacterized protein (DUF1330 family)
VECSRDRDQSIKIYQYLKHPWGKEAALKFWHSPESAEVKKLREGIADCDVMLIED